MRLTNYELKVIRSASKFKVPCNVYVQLPAHAHIGSVAQAPKLRAKGKAQGCRPSSCRHGADAAAQHTEYCGRRRLPFSAGIQATIADAVAASRVIDPIPCNT